MSAEKLAFAKDGDDGNGDKNNLTLPNQARLILILLSFFVLKKIALAGMENLGSFGFNLFSVIFCSR